MKTSKHDSKLETLRGAAGVERASYFAAGLPLAGWRGLHQVQVNRKARANRKACRGRVRGED